MPRPEKDMASSSVFVVSVTLLTSSQSLYPLSNEYAEENIIETQPACPSRARRLSIVHVALED